MEGPFIKGLLAEARDSWLCSPRAESFDVRTGMLLSEEPNDRGLAIFEGRLR
jgi:hypothetical protein